jgi:hypothetical protein
LLEIRSSGFINPWRQPHLEKPTMQASLHALRSNLNLIARMELIFYICAGGFLVFGMAAFIMWAIWIHRYVAAHGERTAFFLYNMAPLLDYRTARRISERTGRKLQFLVWYERLQIGAIAFFIAGVGTLLIWQLR